MTTDINGTVTGIQGNPISPASPSDGYVLTWSQVDGYWVGRPGATGGMTTIYFTSNGTWTCPAGVNNIIIIGAGGGAGGQGGYQYIGGVGGTASTQQTSISLVISGTTYSVIIGQGGVGGNGGHNTSSGINFPPGNGASGGNTVLKLGSTNIFSAAGANVIRTANNTTIDLAIGGYSTSTDNGFGHTNILNTFAGGSPGNNAPGAYQNGIGGGGGGAGAQGIGPNGGNAMIGPNNTGENGFDASPNTGSGGAGGGSVSMIDYSSYDIIGGTGGRGSSGYLYIIF